MNIDYLIRNHNLKFIVRLNDRRVIDVTPLIRFSFCKLSEEEKKDDTESEDDDMGFGLFE